uniref:Uncharacterized protein n=1 Tax=Desmodus rotundus TaxID=9430 RepID=K9IW32_DESRO
MLYFTSPQLFCNYLFILLDPFTIFTHYPQSPPIWQLSKCCLYLRFCLCSYLFSILDSIADRYVFIAIFVHIFYLLFLKETLKHFI